jgi:hypothetical protein
MTRAAVKRCAEENPARRRDPIVGVVGQVLVFDGAAFVVVMLHRLNPVATSWSSVGFSTGRRDLLGQTIEWLVAVERADDPVAVGPDLAVVVEMQPVGVGVPRGVEPLTGRCSP